MNKQMGMKLPKLVDTVFEISRIVQWKSDFKYYAFLSTNITLKFSIVFLLQQPQRMKWKCVTHEPKHVGFLGAEGYNTYKKNPKKTIGVGISQ